MSRRYPTPEEVRAFAVDPDADLTTSALECDGNPLVCDDHGCEMARAGRPCPFRVSPRERAEALGWVRGEGWWKCRTCAPVQWQNVVAFVWTGWLVRGRRGPWRTEDEALEHALLLLDVWLS